MKPGARTRPDPSTTSSPGAGAARPTVAIRSPSILTLACRPRAPVPSRTVAPTMIVARDVAAAGGAESPVTSPAARPRTAETSTPEGIRTPRNLDKRSLLGAITGAGTQGERRAERRAQRRLHSL